MHSALLVGVGGLGCPVLLALAHHVRLTIADSDQVALSNLQRQILYRTSDVGRLKVECATEHLRTRFPDAQIRPLAVDVTASNARDLIDGHNLVIDGTDSFSTKFLLNDHCLDLGVPLIHGAVAGWTGQLMTIARGHACYRCIFEEPPIDPVAATCQGTGVLGAVCGVTGGWMALEALAVLAGRPTLTGTLRVFDARRDTVRDIKPRRRSSCTVHSASEVATW